MNETILLYGPSGSGKTVVGRQLANNLAASFFDLDEEIELLTGRKIEEMFSDQGETHFRELEYTCLKNLLESGQVIALGGGTLTYAPSRNLLADRHQVVVLRASKEVLLSRLQFDSNHQRPLLAGNIRDRLSDLLSTRNAHYSSFPDHVDTSNLTPEQAAWHIQIKMGRFNVKNANYDVQVIQGGLTSVGKQMLACGLNGSPIVISDTNVGNLYAHLVRCSLVAAGFSPREILISPGEDKKSFETLTHLWRSCLKLGVDRKSTIIALGGGVIGDLAGFTAATILRGISWVNIPTTLLAMCDASIGGKTGIDLPEGKNLVGAFHSPRLVVADPQVLTSLPETELRNGLAEALKHGVISDPTLFELCQTCRMDEIVRHSIAVKIAIVQDDPFEKGCRAALNFGHTIGHAIEKVSNYRLKHGEAVAIGMVAEARLAEAIGLAEKGLADTISTALQTINLPIEIPSDLDHAEIIHSISFDKKRIDGKVFFALPVRIGEVKVGVEVNNYKEILWSQF